MFWLLIRHRTVSLPVDEKKVECETLFHEMMDILEEKNKSATLDQSVTIGIVKDEIRVIVFANRIV